MFNNLKNNNMIHCSCTSLKFNESYEIYIRVPLLKYILNINKTNVYIDCNTCILSYSGKINEDVKRSQ